MDMFEDKWISSSKTDQFVFLIIEHLYLQMNNLKEGKRKIVLSAQTLLFFYHYFLHFHHLNKNKCE